MTYFLIFFGFILRIAYHFHDHPMLAAIFAHLPNIPNFAPIAALALFSGVYLKKHLALIIPLAAMFASDLLIGFYNPYIMISVYGSFLLIGLLGIWLRKNKNILNIISCGLLGSVIFFLITNFTVWAVPNSFYPHTLAGLFDCYTLALPFFRNTITGDLFYISVFFGLMETITILVKKFAQKQSFIKTN